MVKPFSNPRKKNSNRYIFFKSIKKFKIDKPFSNPKIMRNQKIFLKSTNKLDIGESFSNIQIYRLKHKHKCKRNTSTDLSWKSINLNITKCILVDVTVYSLFEFKMVVRDQFCIYCK